MNAFLRHRTVLPAILCFLLVTPALAQTPSWAELASPELHPALQHFDVPGSTQSRQDFNPSGSSPIFLPVQSRSAVNVEWEVWFDGHGENDYAEEIAIGPDGSVYVTGWSVVVPGNNQFATVKYTPDGEELWRATYDDPAGMWDESYAIAVDGEGNAIIAGRAFGAGGFRQVTIKYSTDGEELWVRRSNTVAVTKAVAVDSEGNAYVAGVLFGASSGMALTKYTPDGEEAWLRVIEVPGADPNTGIPVVVIDDNTIYFGGSVHSEENGSGGVDYYYFRYDANGNEVWSLRHPAPNAVNWFSVMTADSQGNLYIGGGTNDRRFVKVTPDGEVAWEAFIGGEGGAVGALIADADGNVFVGGVTGCGGGVGCFSVSKYDDSGNLIWDHGYPGYYTFINVVQDLAIDDSGNVYATGRSEKEASLATDYVTAKYHTDGGELWLHRYDAGETASSSATGVAVFSESEAAYVTGSSSANGHNDFLTVKYVSGAGSLTLTPAEIDFGTLFLGETTNAEFVLHNSTMASESVELGLSDPTVGVTIEPAGSITLAPGEAVDIVVTFAPVEPGTITTVLQIVTEAGEALEGFITGTGQYAPAATLSTTEIVFTLDPENNPTETQAVTLSNDTPAGGGNLDFWVSYSSARVVEEGTGQVDDLSLRHSTRISGMNGVPAAQPYTVVSGSGVLHQRGSESTITHSASMEVLAEFGVACGMGTYTMQNSYWRVFDLGQFPEITGSFKPTSVTIGVETATTPLESSVTLYKLTGPLAHENLVPVTQKTFTLDAAPQYLLDLDLDPSEFNNTEVLVLEWSVASGEESMGSVFPGSNYYGQTGPTYISSSDDCGLEGIMDLEEVGFPEVHWVSSVTGETGVGLLTISPLDGSVAPGESTDLSITADASTLAPGLYPFEVSIGSNDPESPVVTVDVQMTVGTVSTNGEGTPLTFDLLPNYPNPFTGTTTIEFALPQAEHVLIEVVDLTGRRVALLVDEQMDAARHEVTWNANGLASGVYLYRMQAGSFTKTLRTTLVR